MEDVFKNDLLQGEKILWLGRPDPNALFSSADTFMIPFSLLWGGFAFFWEATVFFTPAPFFFKLFGIPFVLMGLYFIFGRFIYKKMRKEKTYYAVTDKRVIILSNLFSKHLEAAFINTIPTMNKSIKGNGSGTIVFGNPNMFASWYGNTGLEFFGMYYGVNVPTFYDVTEANRVYDMVNELRNKANQ